MYNVRDCGCSCGFLVGAGVLFSRYGSFVFLFCILLRMAFCAWIFLRLFLCTGAKNNRCSSDSIFGAISDFARCPCPCEDSTNSIKGTEAAFSPFRRLIMVHNSFEGTSIVRLQLYVPPPPFIPHYTSSPAGSAYHDNFPTLSTPSSTALTPPVPFSHSPSPSDPQTPQRRYNST